MRSSDGSPMPARCRGQSPHEAARAIRPHRGRRPGQPQGRHGDDSFGNRLDAGERPARRLGAARVVSAIPVAPSETVDMPAARADSWYA
jgi:hypothetical protein